MYAAPNVSTGSEQDLDHVASGDIVVFLGAPDADAIASHSGPEGR